MLLPTIKAYIAEILVKEYSFSQLRTARILNMKQSAVNYIVTGKRRVKYHDILEKSTELKNLVREVIERINNTSTFDPCEVCNKITSNSTLYTSIMSSLGITQTSIKCSHISR